MAPFSKAKIKFAPGELVVALMGIASDDETIREGDTVSSDHILVRRSPQFFRPQGWTTQQHHQARQQLFDAREGRGIDR